MVCSMGILRWWRKRQTGNVSLSSGESATRAAADAGSAEAQFGLGLHFSANGGGERDLVQSARWYEMAALQGHALAQVNLAAMFARGQGVGRSEESALKWTRCAAEGGDAGAQFLLGRRFHRSSINRMATDCAESRIEAYKWFRLSANQGYAGSKEACDEMSMQMTYADVSEGNQRAASFVVRSSGGAVMGAAREN